MSYINDYFKEIDTSETGKVISGDQSRVITVYVRAYKYDDMPLTHVHRGDPVFIDPNTRNGYDNNLLNGTVIAYDPRHNYAPVQPDDVDHRPTSIAGIALTEPEYKSGEHFSLPFPIAITGEVIANVYAGVIRTNANRLGQYYVGEYIAADGTPSATEDWYPGSKLVLGQIIAPKTDTLTDRPSSIDTRLYARREGDDELFYHMPIRLTCGTVIPPQDAKVDANERVTAKNIGEADIEANAVVAVSRNINELGEVEWQIRTNANGDYANGMALETIATGATGLVMVSGQIAYTHNAVYHTIASSPRARLTPFGAKIVAAGALKGADEAAEDIFAGYYVGMRVTDELMPIETGVPGNQYGTITALNREEGTITLTLDPVATHAPANITPVTIDTVAINDETPVGTALIENPITHAMEPCRFDTDNVDGVLMPATQVPTIYGWTMLDYRAHFGNTVFMAPDGSFWSGFKSFAKGVYKRVIKPVAKWAIGIALPVASSYVSPLGNVLASHVATKCGQLLVAVGGPVPPTNTLTSIYGGRIRSDDMVETYTDNGGGYTSSHPNATYVYDIDAPTENTTWALGDCLRVNPTTGKAVKITSYDTPIEAVVNFAPAQDPESNGWKIAGVARGYHEIRSNSLKVGTPVMYDGTDATNRLAQKLATAIIGYVREVWQPSTATLAAVKAGKLPADEELPNCIVEVKPEFFEAVTPDPETLEVTMAYHDPEGLTPSKADNGDGGQND